MRRSLRALGRSAAAAAAALLVLSSCGSEATPAGEPSGTAVEPPFDVAATTLRDTEGEPFALAEDTTDPLTLVFFGYTRCPDVCPAVMSTITSALTRLDEETREQVQVVFVTTDPSRDDAATLRRYLDRFDEDFVGVTGELAEIGELAESVGVFVAGAEELASGGYDLGSHGAQVIAVDQDGQAPMYWGQDTSSAEYAHDIELLVGDL
ncbi:SCO family protein [Nocardioides ochotonae]|uniref:SCO family protein n=1 Tax=Nocardioides ochotonae TaxID=2685869 RepID=UPI001CD271AB|nr:SCO family protein [Nocardioides ochotonae]